MSIESIHPAEDATENDKFVATPFICMVILSQLLI
jgi:hypothetical protein